MGSAALETGVQFALAGKELVPEGVENENVFDIQKGVAVALFVKRPGAPRGVWDADIWGSRQQKYQSAASASFQSVTWKEVECFSPYYMFKPLDWTHWPEYEPGWPVADVLNPNREKRQIFELNVLGFQTHRDHFAIALEKSKIEERVRAMINNSLSDRELSERYNISDNRDWKLSRARKDLRARKLMRWGRSFAAHIVHSISLFASLGKSLWTIPAASWSSMSRGATISSS